MCVYPSSPPALPTERARPEHSDTPIAVSILNIQVLSSKNHFPIKETRAFLRNEQLIPGLGKDDKVSLEYFVVAKTKEVSK